jgi:glycosyltransferase involved in cell wall biosynthesis
MSGGGLRQIWRKFDRATKFEYRVLDVSTALFVQRRPHRTGAQVALSHLLDQPAVRNLDRVLLTSEHGWLTDEADRLGARSIVAPFPSSRSLPDRLIGTRRFAAHVLRDANVTPALIIANDHLEGLIAVELARQARCPSAMILRSSGMSERDFFKYRCDRFDLIYAAGDELARNASRWVPDRSVIAFCDGVHWQGFRDVKRKPGQFPLRILVVGSRSPAKGWQDVATAIDALEQKIEGFPALTVDFTGSREDVVESGVNLDRPRRACFRFVGRKADFAALVREYDLVVHASRNESVGLAMLETVAAGVPLLCSRVGAIDKVGKSSDWLFRPGAPDDLAAKIENLWRNWPSVAGDMSVAQENVRARFVAHDSLRSLATDLRSSMSVSVPGDIREAEVV